MTDDDTYLSIDLEPIDPSLLRSTEGTGVWETVRGKRNRITIGRPRWLDPADAIALNTCERIHRDYPGHTAKVVRLSLTLLPDMRCRFRSADLVLTLSGDATFAHLEPREQLTTLTVTTSPAGAHANLTVPSIAEIGLTSGGHSTNLTRTEATIEAFGKGSAEAGWRLAMNATRDLPLQSPDLSAVVVRPDSGPHQLEVSMRITAVAEIDVLTVGDKWLTWAFKHTKPEAALDGSFPLL